MTAPVPAGPTDAQAGGEELRKRLADMLVRCGIERGVLGRIDADNVARILLPIVESHARQRAAEELRAAAGEIPRFSPAVIAKWLRQRADALTGHEEAQTVQGGVWVAYYSDRSAFVPFAAEIDALRHALGLSMDVQFVLYGDDDWMSRR